MLIDIMHNFHYYITDDFLEPQKAIECSTSRSNSEVCLQGTNKL